MTGSNMKRWRVEKPIELQSKRFRRDTDKSDPSSVKESMAMMRTKEEALEYLKLVTATLKEDEGGKYDEFLQVLKDFQSKNIDTATVASRVKKLFINYPRLLLGFNAFLPRGHKYPDALIGLSSSSREGDSEQVSLQKRHAQDRVAEDNARQKRSLDLQRALNFVNKVKVRFQKREQVYTLFLDILNLYKQGRPIAEVTRKISALFFGHTDLVEEFALFLPSRYLSSAAFKPTVPSNAVSEDEADNDDEADNNAVCNAVCEHKDADTSCEDEAEFEDEAENAGCENEADRSTQVHPNDETKIDDRVKNSLENVGEDDLSFVPSRAQPARDGESSMATEVHEINGRKAVKRPASPVDRAAGCQSLPLGPTVETNASCDLEASRVSQDQHIDKKRVAKRDASQMDIDRGTDLTHRPTLDADRGSDGEPFEVEPVLTIEEIKYGKKSPSPIQLDHGATVSVVKPLGQAKVGRDGDTKRVSQDQQVHEKNSGKRPASPIDIDGEEDDSLNVALVQSPRQIKKQRKEVDRDEEENGKADLSESEESGREASEPPDVPQKLPQKRSSARIADELIRKQCQAADLGPIIQGSFPLLSKEELERMRLEDVEEEKKKLVMKERQRKYFANVKATLARSHGSEQLSNCLRNLSRMIMSCPELQTLVSYSLEEQEVDYSQCKRSTPSYFLLPKSYLKPLATRRKESTLEFLNDCWVSVGYDGECKQNPHDEGNAARKQIRRDGASKRIPHDKRLIHEEKLSLCEDDQFEFDVLHETTANTIARLAEMVKITSSAEFVLESFDWDQYLTPINLRCIERIYNDYGLDFIQQARKNPVVALPIILQRLMQKKDDEWSEYKARMNSFWSEVHNEHYHKSLDYSQSYGRQMDVEPLGIDSFPIEPELEEDLCDGSAYADGKRRLSFENTDMENVYQIIKYLLREVCMTTEQFKKFRILWSKHVRSIVSDSPDTFSDEEEEDEEGQAKV